MWLYFDKQTQSFLPISLYSSMQAALDKTSRGDSGTVLAFILQKELYKSYKSNKLIVVKQGCTMAVFDN